MSDAPDFAPDRRSTVISRQEKELSTASVEVTSPIPTGETIRRDISVSVGAFADLRGVKFDVAPPGGSGVHRFRLETPTDPVFPLVEVEANASDPIRFAFFDVLAPSAPTSVFPSSSSARVESIRGVTFDDDSPVTLVYTNESGVLQSNPRTFAARIVETVVE
jgi:hypothetical protein